MFDQFKQLNKLRQMQKELEKQRIEAEVNGVKIVLSGKMQVIELRLNHDLDNTAQEQAVKEAFNQAMTKLQQSIAGSMMG